MSVNKKKCSVCMTTFKEERFPKTKHKDDPLVCISCKEENKCPVVRVKIRECLGVMCRETGKKFRSINGRRLCDRCHDHNRGIGEDSLKY